MKVTILFTIFIVINSIALSKSDYCQCQCCINKPDDVDCQVNMIGNITIDSCPVDTTTICKDKCQTQYPTQCNQNNGTVAATCFLDASTSINPPTTTIMNGPVQCKCSCCVGVPCDAVHQGDIIVEKCDLCQTECTNTYLSHCTKPSATIIAECGPAPHNIASKIHFNMIFLLIFLISKYSFL